MNKLRTEVLNVSNGPPVAPNPTHLLEIQQYNTGNSALTRFVWDFIYFSTSPCISWLLELVRSNASTVTRGYSLY